jgi:hypothetical protein
MTQIPEPNIDWEETKDIELGEIRFSKINPFRKGNYCVGLGNGELQIFEEYEHAVIFAEIIKNKGKKK